MDTLRDTTPTIAGRYLIFFGGEECGEDRWELRPREDGFVLEGEQTTIAPHPFPNRQAYRATLTPEWRLTGLEVLWIVRHRTLRATPGARRGASTRRGGGCGWWGPPARLGRRLGDPAPRA